MATLNSTTKLSQIVRMLPVALVLTYQLGRGMIGVCGPVNSIIHFLKTLICSNLGGGKDEKMGCGGVKAILNFESTRYLYFGGGWIMVMAGLAAIKTNPRIDKT